MINIVVPMAGKGSRFKTEGFPMPKPLIPVKNKPMIQLVIDNLKPRRPHRFIFICLEEHLADHNLENLLKTWAPGALVIPLKEVTEGAACTVLLAEKFINNSTPLMIANCDQWVDIDINHYLAESDKPNLDGLIMTMKANDPKWSFVRFNPSGKIDGVLEKQVVSDEATVGIYNFKRGSDYVSAAKSMIAKNKRVNGEFYVAPVYNELIETGAKLGIYNVGSELNGMYGLGIPSDLKKFLEIKSDSL